MHFCASSIILGILSFKMVAIVVFEILACDIFDIHKLDQGHGVQFKKWKIPTSTNANHSFLAVAVTVFCEIVEIEMVPFHDKYQNQ